MTKTQTLEAETTQKGMTVLKQVIGTINREIYELLFLREKNNGSCQEWFTENAIKIETLQMLRSRIRSEVKE